VTLRVLFEDRDPAAETARHVFRGARGRVAWPTAAGHGLGPAGAWNVLWRLGCRPAVTCADEGDPDPGDVLFVCGPAPAAAKAIATAKRWLSAGASVVATTPDPAWGAFLEGAELLPSRPDFPYAALAALFPGQPPELIAPPGWGFVTVARAAGASARGDLAVVHGERQTPGRALITPIPSAPAVLRNGAFVFLNGDPFAAFQAWLQGQEPLESWLAWRHRLFWLDELASSLGTLLDAERILPTPAQRTGIPGLGKTTVVLRHDLDESRETAYLDEERHRGLAGVHCVLRDRNTRFWVERLAGEAGGHESAFHYNTVAGGSIAQRLRRPSRPPALRPARADVTGRALLRQVRWARARGIGTATLHRHGAFLVYPEWVDALDAVFEEEPEVLGASSLFRGQVLRWGAERFRPDAGSAGDFPDAQFPLWLPFRLAHAGQGGRLLRGWETTSVMESEPALVEQLLGHRLPGLPQRVLVLGYHPAHARRPSYRAGGSLPWFREVLDLIERSGAEVRTLRAVFEACRAGTS
jgi:hypothetical protein